MRMLWGIFVLMTASPGWSEELFAGTGEYGEASFSDVAREGYEPIHVEVQPVDEIAAATTRRTTGAIKEIADSMAEERKARALARARGRSKAGRLRSTRRSQ